RRGTDPARANLLLAQAHEESQDILTDLREVAWRIYPTALDNLGLRDAIARAVDHTPLPADLDLTLHPDDRPPPEVETAAYFIISEALTNTTKHANATHLSIQVTQTPTALALRITDNGKGGATPTGTGLSGLHRRVAAMDGTFHLTSPPGHGTTITAHLPYP
ncbi:sensor histidine kinase, partial [Crossiella equi]